MRILEILTLFLLLFRYADAYNYLVVCPIFAYSHIKFMSKVADTLANGGHRVTLLQTYHVEHWGRKIRLAKNKNVKIIDYHLTENEGVDEKKTASAHKYLWSTEYLNNPIGAIAPMFVLYEQFSPMCEKIYTDKKLHKLILDEQFDGYVAEAFDFCSLYLGDYLKLNLLPMFSSIKNVPASRAIGEPSLLNYGPTLHTNYGADQTVWDRVQDITMATSFYYALANLFDRQHTQAQSLMNGTVRHWKEILQTATFFFYNSNPYIQFAMPRLEKSVEIGGFTIGDSKSDKVDKENGIIKAFASLPDTTFIWKYEETDEKALKNLNVPENVILKTWIPQPELLSDQRLDLFITHGGLGSTLEVAYSGKPSIMIPIFGDQLINAKMLSRHGGSIAFNKYKLENSEELCQVIREALSSPAIRSNAQHLAEILKNQPVDPKTNLLRHAEFSAKFGRVESLQPYNVHYNFVQFYMLDAYAIIIMFITLLVYIGYTVTLRVMRKCFYGRKTEKLE